MMALATIGMLIILGFGFQIAPIWLYGPATPTQISAGSVPDWYMGFLDGALRIMPGWELTLGDYTLSLAVLVPTLVIPGSFSPPWPPTRRPSASSPRVAAAATRWAGPSRRAARPARRPGVTCSTGPARRR